MGNSLQDIVAYRYLRKHSIGNEAERIERRLYVGRRLEVGETRRMNAYRIVGEPAAQELEGVERKGAISPVWQVESGIQSRRAWVCVCSRV